MQSGKQPAPTEATSLSTQDPPSIEKTSDTMVPSCMDFNRQASSTSALHADDETASDANAPGLDPKIQMQLGRQLSAYYTELIEQPVPDAFLVLLKKLEAKEKGE